MTSFVFQSEKKFSFSRAARAVGGFVREQWFPCLLGGAAALMAGPFLIGLGLVAGGLLGAALLSTTGKKIKRSLLVALVGFGIASGFSPFLHDAKVERNEAICSAFHQAAAGVADAKSSYQTQDWAYSYGRKDDHPVHAWMLSNFKGVLIDEGLKYSFYIVAPSTNAKAGTNLIRTDDLSGPIFCPASPAP